MRTILWILTMLSLAFAFPCAADDLEDAVKLMNEGWGARAENQFEVLTAQDPERAEVWYQWAWARFYAKDFEGAEKYIDKAVALEPDNPDYLLLQGHSVGRRAQTGSKLKAVGRAKKCRRCYEQAIAVDAGHVEAYSSLIQFLIQAPGIAGGDKDKARQMAEDLTKVDPVEGHRMVAMVSEQVDKDLGAAEAALRTAMATVADDGEKSDQAIGNFVNFCIRHDMVTEAENILNERLRLPGEETKARYGLASFYQSRRDWDAAAEQWRALAAVDSTRLQGLNGLGYLALVREDWPAAAAYFDTLLASDETRGDALYQAARSRMHGKLELDRAVAGFRDYLEREPNLWWPSKAWAHARLAETLLETGDADGAADEIKRAKKLKSKDDRLKDKLKELTKAIEDPWEDDY